VRISPTVSTRRSINFAGMKAPPFPYIEFSKPRDQAALAMNSRRRRRPRQHY
jgi:hypothetical protein